MRIFILLLLFLVFGACAGYLRQQTVCDQNHDDPKIQTLMRSACSGDRSAQYELGVMFDDGIGVIADPALAATYYKLAAAIDQGKSYIYVPGAGSVAGHVMPVDNGRSHPGHARAKYRLALLYQKGRGVKRNQEKAAKYFAAAAREGVDSLN